MNSKHAVTALAIAVASLWSLANAQTPNATPAAPSAAASAGSGGMEMSKGMPMADMTDGEVRKVDRDNKKITLKHGEIKSLQMPGMTMVFQVKDAAMLDMVKQGDKVRFKAEKAGGALVVTEIQPVK